MQEQASMQMPDIDRKDSVNYMANIILRYMLIEKYKYHQTILSIMDRKVMVFINKNKARELGLTIDKLTVHEVMNNKELGVIFPVPIETDEKNKLENSADFLKYKNSSLYVMKEKYVGN